ncbi:hypothetical protein FNV43_RR06824 [Rhamnella rubrinervis]|uniref:Cyanobacterial aminoacyl-tRNA synthetase CAAD domain-containing protein n=1 Tax=Rhamnella rubrinervis TaxID=2594499 RepID=A0A8K0HF99_9ROSA|nr:hypothetical protein FNV43_RR06824 [Rhamnella rubrinervis]
MASIVASLPPPLFLSERKTLFIALPKLPVSSIRERQNRVSVAVKATGEGSDSSTSLSIVKSVQNVWDKSEDRVALVGLGFAAVVALWASVNLITAIDRLPLIPSILEFVGILFSSVRKLLSTFALVPIRDGGDHLMRNLYCPSLLSFNVIESRYKKLLISRVYTEKSAMTLLDSFVFYIQGRAFPNHRQSNIRYLGVVRSATH